MSVQPSSPTKRIHSWEGVKHPSSFFPTLQLSELTFSDKTWRLLLHRQMVFPQNGADRMTKLQNIGLNSLPTMPGVFLCLNGFYEGMALGQGSLDKAT
jgi:hypothetical protein